MNTREIEDIYSLSPMQQGMLYHSIYAPDSAVYLEQLSCTLEGRLDLGAFQRAWQEVARRHTVLRTSFIWEDLDEPLQIVHRNVDLKVSFQDWRLLEREEQSRAMEDFLRLDLKTGFNLTDVPLIRLALIQLGESEYRFVWTNHHLLLDGWSLPVLLQEVFAYYEAFHQGKDLYIRPTHPYREYIAWIQGQDRSQAENYWRKYLDGFYPLTPLSTILKDHRDHIDPQELSGVAILKASLGPEVTQKLRKASQQYGLTANTWVQGAWALLLSRYSNEQDVVFGATVAGRPGDLPGADTMLGLFINTLPVRAQIEPTQSVFEWLKSFQTRQAAARQFEYSSLVDIQSWSGISSGQSLFDTILVFENYPVETSLKDQRGSLQIRDVDHYGKTNYPLTVVISPGSDLGIQLVYDPQQFDPEVVQRMLGHMVQVLGNMVINNDQALGSIKMLTPGEEEQLVLGWNNRPRTTLAAQLLNTTSTEYSTVVKLFKEQVGRAPRAEAIVFVGDDGQERVLTYQELDQRSNQLANGLRNIGVGSEMLVGISVERSMEMVVALWGVLKAGGAYVPLDPKYPAERLEFMIQDAGIRVLLTQASVIERLSETIGDALTPLQVVCLDVDWDRVAGQDASLSEEKNTQDLETTQAAYVIYTSGSTGTPKGVVIPHAALVNHALHMADILELRPGARMAQLISLSFDAAGEEIYPTLLSGATLVLPHTSMEVSGKNILDFCEQYRISDLHLPVPLWNQIVDEMIAHQLAMPSNLQTLLVGGESPSVEKLKIWESFTNQPMHFINAYGPTEATITTTIYKTSIGTETSKVRQQIPIGQPIPNARVYILDRLLNPTPVRVPGEIFIGGAGLARGYLNRPELTAERFISDPFISKYPQINWIGEHLYRTGDLGRYLDDGNIEFIGRADYQVKLRGYRIELEEIEAIIRQFEPVREGVVIVREDSLGGRESAADKRLVAYIVLEQTSVESLSEAAAPSVANQNETLERLRAYLKERLPDYMVPAWFVVLADAPRLPNGKIDRRAIAQLPPPEGTALVGAKYVAPRDAVEEIIAGLWADILGVSLPGVHDNFFDLGGHSLKATQLLSRIRQTFQADIPLRSLFESPTIAGMAVVVREVVSGESALSKTITPIPREETSGIPLEPPPLSFSQQRLWFLDQLDPGSLTHNIPAAVRITGKLDTLALEKSLNELIRRHESLRTTFADGDGHPVQIIAPEFNISLPIFDWIALGGSQSEGILTESDHIDSVIQDWAKSQVQIPFDLSTGPLIRSGLLRIDDNESILVVTIHHIVSDGWSMGILVKEIAILYESFSVGKEASLPNLRLQYADYAAWQREWMSGEELERQLTYWKDRLAGMPPLLDLPTDRPRPALKSSNGAVAMFNFSSELSDAIQTLARLEGVTVYMLLLAAFQTLLYRYSGQEDISVGSAIANRTRPEVENLIGFFVNTLVLRTDLSGDPSFRELLQRVREVALGAYAHQDLPFEMLVETLQPQRNLSFTPLFQVGFDLQEVPVKSLELPGLTLSPITTHSGSAAFDMLMSITQSPRLGTIAGKLGGSLEYNTDLFDETTISRLLSHFEQLLIAITADPDQAISGLRMLTDTELHQLWVEWNNSDADFARDRCIHQLFEAHAAQHPEQLALMYTSAVSADVQLMTYLELNRRANLVANYLAAQGIGPEELVGISTERSTEMIVGILGILKAGGAYIPLDPNYPPDRLEFMLQDSGVKILLSQKGVFDRLGGLLSGRKNGDPILAGATERKVVCLDSDWDLVDQVATAQAGLQAADNLANLSTPENLAYVIYTSGSTGRPKGTLLRHRGLCNLVEWQRNVFEIGHQSRILQFSPFSFDASVWETFMALANGATLCLAAQEILGNGLELVRLLKDQGITTVTLPPSVLAVLPAEAVTAEALPSLRNVIAAGEACSKEIVDRYAPGRKFFDAYGPTETTVCATAALIEVGGSNQEEPGVHATDGEPTIGRPIANTHLYVLDSHLGPLPIGIPGELLVGGVSVGRGYLNRPDLTKERFIPNPQAGYLRKAGYSDRAQETLYRTGDLVRYRPDGNLEFLGRIDQQVKVHGYRIELGEIEAALRRFSEPVAGGGDQIIRLREATVVVREDQPGDKRLVAFIVPEVVESTELSDSTASSVGGQPTSRQDALITTQVASNRLDGGLINSLRRFLRQTLPEYMVPSAFVVIDSLPLSPSGKVDRKALSSRPITSSGREMIGSEYEAPRTDMELELCKITADLLGIKWVREKSPIGIRDNFFEIGGHSLLATQFISRVRDAFGVELPLRTLFEHPTIAEMGETITSMKQSGVESQAPGLSTTAAIRPVARDAHRMKQTTGGWQPVVKPKTPSPEKKDGLIQ
jgi:amino acid adenylation domain-containing protein